MAEEHTVASLSELYLGNILYALELAALSLTDQGKPDDAAYYRAIGRALAEAHGRAKTAEEGGPPPIVT
ncbi:MAG TPA: hypothetical protein VGP25_08475 [Gemmatimonadaceae bacterium]|nr:hypothetical protein [Gemmatimonadaceae bacterium]